MGVIKCGAEASAARGGRDPTPTACVRRPSPLLLHFFHSRRFFYGFGESVCRERATLLCSAPS